MQKLLTLSGTTKTSFPTFSEIKRVNEDHIFVTYRRIHACVPRSQIDLCISYLTHYDDEEVVVNSLKNLSLNYDRALNCQLSSCEMDQFIRDLVVNYSSNVVSGYCSLSETLN